jgi:hypothetical protein
MKWAANQALAALFELLGFALWGRQPDLNQETTRMKCPVCKIEAAETEQGFIDGYGLKCPVHGWIEVSDTALATRSNEPRAAWEMALARARDRAFRERGTIGGQRPRILDMDFGIIVAP